MRVLLGLVFLLVLFPGCVSKAPTSSSGPGSPSASSLPGVPPGPQVLVDFAAVGSNPVVPGAEGDVLCKFGGAPALPRAGGHVVDGTAALVFSVKTNGTTSGMQFGYSLDKGTIHWLNVVAADGTPQRLPVNESGIERENATRWTFYLQENVRQTPQSCDTGATAGDYRARIVAVAV